MHAVEAPERHAHAARHVAQPETAAYERALQRSRIVAEP